MLPRIRADDAALPYGNQGCLLLRLRPSDVRYLHYLISFRVIRGTIEIFGAIYGPSLEYETVVIPPWNGSLLLRVADLSSIISNHTSVGEVPNQRTQCPACHGCCGSIGSDLCQKLQILDWNDKESPTSNYEGTIAIVAFKDVVTAFGRVRAREMVGISSAFHSIMVDNVPEW